MRQVAPGAELAALVADAERERAFDQDPELLVGVTVLRHDGVRIELDERERHPFAVHRAAEDPIPDLLRRDRADVREGLIEGT